ncbi:MAG TPA: DnaA regulatory inactivator Hda [Steroidobacteraceae bacterium]|jgi:DnaA family protein|nr:DnaA regulatory inactivator Hda [Steroidobacteraceae bacterium]
MDAKQLPLGVRLRDTSVFASYFPGRNGSVVDALQALTARRAGPSDGPTCVWVHGPPSVGKTHLLQAMCARANSNAQSAAYLPLAEVAPLGGEILSGYGQFSLVCLDDAETVAGNADWERALFRLHRELDEQRARLVLAAIAPPAALPFKLADLASRLNGGVVLTLQPFDEPEQLAALQLRAQLRGCELPQETAQFLLRRLPRNMAALCAFLDELDEASLIAQRRLTVPFVKAVMKSA